MTINPVVYIVIKNGSFLVAVSYLDTGKVKWSNSKFDAARFEYRETAVRFANLTGGRVEEFNTLTGVIS